MSVDQAEVTRVFDDLARICGGRENDPVLHGVQKFLVAIICDRSATRKEAQGTLAGVMRASSMEIDHDWKFYADQREASEPAPAKS